MTCLPEKTDKKLGLLIDLNICVGCHACAVSCKEWNTSGITGPMEDLKPYGDDPSGVWYNRIHSYEFKKEDEIDRTVYFPKSCLHCEDAPCVTVCPTGASLKRSEDGIVLVNPDVCIGCKLCSWACPYGAREYGHYWRGLCRNVPFVWIKFMMKLFQKSVVFHHVYLLALPVLVIFGDFC